MINKHLFVVVNGTAMLAVDVDVEGTAVVYVDVSEEISD